MNDEIKNILQKTENGEIVFKYIEQLEKNVHHHNNHGESCDCGCHDHEHDHEDDWQEIQSPYKNTLSVQDWEKLLKDKNYFTKDALTILKRMRHIAAPTSYMELADTFGAGAFYYETEIKNLVNKLLHKIKTERTEKEYYWSFLFDAWKNKNSEEIIFALLPELYEAIGNTDLSDIPLRENEI